MTYNMTEIDKNDPSRTKVDLASYRLQKAKERLEKLDLDQQSIEDVRTVLIADFDFALQEGMEEVGVPMSMRMEINHAIRRKLSDSKSE